MPILSSNYPYIKSGYTTSSHDKAVEICNSATGKEVFGGLQEQVSRTSAGGH
jgi:hypothetical protein